MRKRHELRPVVSRVGAIRPDSLLLFSTLRNELVRLPYFLRYYRELGINHFLIVDNGSDDGDDDGKQPRPDDGNQQDGKQHGRKGHPDVDQARHGKVDPATQEASGKAKASGKLPFELPSSWQAVQNQHPDVAKDSANPLYPYGAGLAY